MRQWTSLLIGPVVALGVVGTLLRLGHDATPVPASSPAASPVVASPIAVGSPAATPPTVTEAMATVTALQATVEAQQVEIAVLTIRVDVLETSATTLLESLLEQTAMDSFQQAQIDDLMARLADVEADIDATAVASPMTSPCASPEPMGGDCAQDHAGRQGS